MNTALQNLNEELEDFVTELQVERFLTKYYKPERLNACEGRLQRLTQDRLNDIKTHGYAIISCHDSVTGRAMKLFSNGKSRPCTNKLL